jgi:nitrite reductase/ring-hydroxylating ferredoxin subunit
MPTTPVDIGAPAQYAAGGIFDKFIPNGVIIVSDKTKVYAMTASCTHQRGKLAKDAASNQIKCTKHNGVFTAAGTPVSGPPKVALARFGITKNAAGNLVVDPSKRFEQADWEKEGAFFKLA